MVAGGGVSVPGISSMYPFLMSSPHSLPRLLICFRWNPIFPSQDLLCLSGPVTWGRYHTEKERKNKFSSSFFLVLSLLLLPSFSQDFLTSCWGFLPLFPSILCSFLFFSLRITFMLTIPFFITSLLMVSFYYSEDFFASFFNFFYNHFFLLFSVFSVTPPPPPVFTDSYFPVSTAPSPFFLWCSFFHFQKSEVILFNARKKVKKIMCWWIRLSTSVLANHANMYLQHRQKKRVRDRGRGIVLVWAWSLGGGGGK